MCIEKFVILGKVPEIRIFMRLFVYDSEPSTALHATLFKPTAAAFVLAVGLT